MKCPNCKKVQNGCVTCLNCGCDLQGYTLTGNMGLPKKGQVELTMVLIGVIVLVFAFVCLLAVVRFPVSPSPVYYQYGLQNGEIVCCRNVRHSNGGTKLSDCKDGLEYWAQQNVIDYNKICGE